MSTPSSRTTTPSLVRAVVEGDTLSPLVHAAVFLVGKATVTGAWAPAEEAVARLLAAVRQRRLDGGEGPA